ncbi:hypothetical protein F5Y16DRAFT_383641 [Xylariaceae sp. FL0255]|nr:hypothetical protein F5Y16DRAFT_383641 [Xylariaceae sp. FL0255]
MAPEATRNNDRSTSTQHFTMKTQSRPPLVSSHSHHGVHSRHMQSNLQSFRSNRSSTPTASSRVAHSVGQAYPPSVKVSPVLTSDARTPSPNYFGLNMEKHGGGGDLGDSTDGTRHNWSPQSSSIKSFNTAIPKSVPLDANPEFEAFKRQIDANRGAGTFNLNSSYFSPPPVGPLRPRPPRTTTNQSDATSDTSTARSQSTKSRELSGGRADTDTDSLHDSAYVSSDSKRNSEVSLHAPLLGGMGRFESPTQTDSPFEPLHRSPLSGVADRQSRLSLPHNKPETISGPVKPRAETLPTPDTNAPGMMLPSELKTILQQLPEDEHLLLDVRVATLYSQSRVRGALNLCIPTTLLKRATYNLERLEKTLQTEEDQAKFAAWPDVKYLVIYDGSSTEKRDAVPAMNTFKKFMAEGFSGRTCLLKGGFQAFAAAFPTYIDHRSGADRPGTTVSSSEDGRPSFAPVIGGVSLPTTGNSANPFFGNIRQNMDLADGVGQLNISVPPNMNSDILPQWLREVARTNDHGKIASERFLNIEKKEQTRMRDAYSAFNAPAPTSSNPDKVQLCGVEKGGKNRYKDILPFEHARVRLQNTNAGACDYINASHVQASRSHKRYIATQGPLPATFEDFWSVVWDQDIRVIVMLTAESEGGQLKCHPYWRGRDYGPIKLKPLSEKKVSLDIDKYQPTFASATSFTGSVESGRRRANTTTSLETPATATTSTSTVDGDTHVVVVRKFALSHASHPFAPIREVTHLYYPSWPDFGAPANPSHLLALVELANVMQRAALPVSAHPVAPSSTEHPAPFSWLNEPESDAHARPILVHCSAGCGRTGTFCTVDSVIDMLKRQRLAPMTGSPRRDAEGDVVMGDDEPASPRSSMSERNKKARRSVEIEPEGAGWVGDITTDLIAATVEDFRKQRLSMVQSLRQFVLCYESIVEWVCRFHDQNNNTNNAISSSSRRRARSGSLQEPR